MSDVAIKVEGISKLYKIGAAKKGSIQETLKNIFSGSKNTEKETDFWALKDVSFEIKKGEAVGFIGKNGAGKSTLLKILSKITEPTSGKITINGRVSSLLEVGTGFHPELSGRENIFLNGTILGMKRAEIREKFDEIVAFSGIEKFIDTPVKRYSSGMYVRLAFAVAAHLEPEILIIDEVLAVGDAEFQKKCLGKMEDVSKNDGRTILFVSHTMSAIKQLCSNIVLMKNGSISYQGDVSEGIIRYLEESVTPNIALIEFVPDNNKDISFTKLTTTNIFNKLTSEILFDQNFYINIEFSVNWDVENIEISICFKNSLGINVLFTSLSELFGNRLLNLKKGKYSAQVCVNKIFLLPDIYYLSFYAHYRNYKNVDYREDILKIEIMEMGSSMAPYGTFAKNFTCVLGGTQWTFDNN